MRPPRFLVILAFLSAVVSFSFGSSLTYKLDHINGSGNDMRWYRLNVENRSPETVNWSGQIEGDGFSATLPESRIGPGETETRDIPTMGIFYNINFHPVENGEKLDPISGDSSFYGNGELGLVVTLLSDVPTEQQKVDFGYGTLRSRKSTGSSHTSITAERLPLRFMTPDAVPSNWVYYTTFRYLVVSRQAWDRMKEDQREAMRRFAAWGGLLTIYDAGGDSIKEAGAGHIQEMTANPFHSLQGRIPEKWKWDGVNNWSKNPDPNSWTTRLSSPWNVKPTGGRFGGMILATLFLIIAGPINYTYFKKRKRIRMVIISTPIISAAFCGLIFIYFFVSQGFTKRVSTLSLTALNEKTNQAFTVGVHSFFCGIYPLSGFHFDSETRLLPLSDSGGSNTGGYDLDLNGGLVVRRGLIRSGIESVYATALPHKTREHLVWDAAEHTVINGFDLPLAHVIVQTSGGLYIGGKAQPGGKITLEPFVQRTRLYPDVKPLVEAVAGQLPDNCRSVFMQPLSSIAAEELDSKGVRYGVVFTGDLPEATPGVERDEGESVHVLIGELDDGSEDAE